MKTAYNEVAVELDLQTAIILQGILWAQENAKDESDQNFIAKSYPETTPEELQDKGGKIEYIHTETF